MRLITAATGAVMAINPELRRLLWLELSLQRLWLIPAVLVGIALLAGYGPFGARAIQPLAFAGFVLCTVVWGARQAGNAMLDEVRANTWDIQRMSALGAWDMTWGKLVGATVVAWYAGFICLGIAALHALDSGRAFDSYHALVLVLVAVTLQAFVLMLVTVGRHRSRRLGTRMNVVLTFLFLYLVLPDLPALAGIGMPDLAAPADTAVFYGMHFPAQPFTLALLAAFAAWMILGATRAMSIALLIRTRPVAWLLFIAFLATLAAGLDDGGPTPERLRRWCSACAVYAVALTYIAGFAFRHDPIDFRRMHAAYGARDWRRLLEETPLWLSSAGIALLAALSATALGSDPVIDNQRIDNAGASALALALLAVRDIALLAGFSFRNRGRRAEAPTLLCLALLNRVLPAIVSLGGAGALAMLLRPAVFDAAGSAVVIAALHAAVAAALAFAAYRSAMGTTTGTGGAP